MGWILELKHSYDGFLYSLGVNSFQENIKKIKLMLYFMYIFSSFISVFFHILIISIFIYLGDIQVFITMYKNWLVIYHWDSSGQLWIHTCVICTWHRTRFKFLRFLGVERERDISPNDCYCGFKKNFQRMAYVTRPDVIKGSTTDPKVRSIMPQKNKSWSYVTA